MKCLRVDPCLHLLFEATQVTSIRAIRNRIKIICLITNCCTWVYIPTIETRVPVCEEEPDAETPGADQPCQDLILIWCVLLTHTYTHMKRYQNTIEDWNSKLHCRPQQEQQPHDDAEAGKPTPDPFDRSHWPKDGSRGRMKPKWQDRPGTARNQVVVLKKAWKSYRKGQLFGLDKMYDN